MFKLGPVPCCKLRLVQLYNNVVIAA